MNNRFGREYNLSSVCKNMAFWAMFLFFAEISVSLAQATNTISGLFVNIQSLIKTAIGIAYSLAFLAFFWGVAKFIYNAHNKEAKDAAVNIMVTSIVIIFIMTSIWGIVALIKNTAGVDNVHQGDFKVPTVRSR